MVRLEGDLAATILTLPVLSALPASLASPLICGIIPIPIPCNRDCNGHYNFFVNCNHARIQRLCLPHRHRHRQPCRLLHKVGFHDRAIFGYLYNLYTSKNGRQFQPVAAKKIDNCRAQTLKRRLLISTTRPSPLQNSSLPGCLSLGSPVLTGPLPVTHTPRPTGIEAVSAATRLFQRLHTLHHPITIDQLNSPP